jgi:hypothetical protein
LDTANQSRKATRHARPATIRICVPLQPSMPIGLDPCIIPCPVLQAVIKTKSPIIKSELAIAFVTFLVLMINWFLGMLISGMMVCPIKINPIVYGDGDFAVFLMISQFPPGHR